LFDLYGVLDSNLFWRIEQFGGNIQKKEFLGGIKEKIVEHEVTIQVPLYYI